MNNEDLYSFLLDERLYEALKMVTNGKATGEYEILEGAPDGWRLILTLGSD